MHVTTQRPRAAAPYTAAMLAVIALGLTSRKYPALLPAALGKYPGDALWAMMIFLALTIARPKLPTLKQGVIALLTCYAIELSQLYQAPWINAIRHTTIGHLALGTTFGWIDLLAYTLGIALCVICEKTLPGE